MSRAGIDSAAVFPAGLLTGLFALLFCAAALAEPQAGRKPASDGTNTPLYPSGSDDRPFISPHLSISPKAPECRHNAEALKDYTHNVENRIIGLVRYKPRTERTVWGECTVIIDADGALDSVSLRESSGDPEFDLSALEAAQNSAPFPPPPESALRDGKVSLRIFFSFSALLNGPIYNPDDEKSAGGL